MRRIRTCSRVHTRAHWLLFLCCFGQGIIFFRKFCLGTCTTQKRVPPLPHQPTKKLQTYETQDANKVPTRKGSR